MRKGLRRFRDGDCGEGSASLLPQRISPIDHQGRAGHITGRVAGQVHREWSEIREVLLNLLADVELTVGLAGYAS
jgi:hypothetical protein